jgi:hypothetical protein
VKWGEVEISSTAMAREETMWCSSQNFAERFNWEKEKGENEFDFLCERK